jgi:hypothetical protein
MARTKIDPPALPRHLVLPAVRVQRKGQEPHLALWCPVCRAVHVHGAATPSPVTGRGHHYRDQRFCDAPTGYDLIVVGTVGSTRSVPRLTLDEALALTTLFRSLRQTAADRGGTGGLRAAVSPPLVPAVDAAPADVSA